MRGGRGRYGEEQGGREGQGRTADMSASNLTSHAFGSSTTSNEEKQSHRQYHSQSLHSNAEEGRKKRVPKMKEKE